MSFYRGTGTPGTGTAASRPVRLDELAASDGSSLVGFIQSGTGAVATTVQEELRDTVRGEQFGVVLDGATGNTTNLLKALAYASSVGKKVSLSGGTCLLDSTLALTSSHANSGLLLNGTTISKGFNGTLMTYTNCTKFSIDGVGEIVGNSATYTGKGIVMSGTVTQYPYFGPGIIIRDFADAHIEMGVDSGKYIRTKATIITGSSALAISVPGTDTAAMQRHLDGVVIGYISLVGAVSTFIYCPIVNRVEIGSACSETICHNGSWSNNGVAVTIDGYGTIITGTRISGDVTLSATMTGAFVGNNLTGYTLTDNTSPGNVTVVHNGKMHAQRGTTLLPAYTFAGDLDSGFWQRTAGILNFSNNGTTNFEWQATKYLLGSTTLVGWCDTAAVPSATAIDTSVFRAAAGISAAGIGGVLISTLGGFAAKLYPATDAGAYQTATKLLGGTGAPNNANGADGDFYFRSDGGALTSIYQRRAGAWVGIV